MVTVELEPALAEHVLVPVTGRALLCGEGEHSRGTHGPSWGKWSPVGVAGREGVSRTQADCWNPLCFVSSSVRTDLMDGACCHM